MKIVIVMTYFQRQKQLDLTLESLTYQNPKDFSIIIVDDDSPDDIKLKEYKFKIKIIKLKNKTWHNTGNVFNVGFIEALKSKPDAIIIQNAECYHWGKTIDYIKENLTNEHF